MTRSKKLNGRAGAGVVNGPFCEVPTPLIRSRADARCPASTETRRPAGAAGTFGVDPVRLRARGSMPP